MNNFKKLLFLLIPLLLTANMLKVNEEVTPITLKSQHDKKYLLKSNGIWIIAWDKSTTHIANNFFKNNKMDKDINLIVDTSKIPSIFFSMFGKPKFKKYLHPILLSWDETYNSTLPYIEDALTILYIKDNKIEDIKYIYSELALKKLLK